MGWMGGGGQRGLRGCFEPQASQERVRRQSDDWNGSSTILETTQGQIDGFFSQLRFKYYLPEVASMGDRLKIRPWVAFGVVSICI